MFHNTYLLTWFLGGLNALLLIASLCVFVWAAWDSRRERLSRARKDSTPAEGGPPVANPPGAEQ